MNKYFFFFAFLLVASVSAQNISIQDFTLTGVKTKIKFSNILANPDSINLKITSEDYSEIKSFSTQDNNGEIEYVFTRYGSYKVQILELENVTKSIRVMPGWFSIVPPLLAILLALLMRQVVVALAAGTFIGAFFIYNYNPIAATFRMADSIMMDSLLDPDHMIIVLFTLLIGGVVGVISKNGGTAGLAKIITKFAKTVKSTLLSSWLLGIVIFFDDYANSLIVGNLMRPITDRVKISREKLSYIVDSTAAPVASLILISTWIGYQVGLINDGLKAIGSNQNGYEVFLGALPYSFYTIAALFFVFLTSITGKDFGPMYKAEYRARKTGEVCRKDSHVADFEGEKTLFQQKNPKWYNGAIPVAVILFGTILGLVLTGTSKLDELGITDYSVQDIISYANSYASLLWASFAACLVAIIITVSQKILTLNKAVEAWQDGLQSMLIAVIILVFAWSISSVTTQLRTADYIISILSGVLDPAYLPVIVFLICSVICFSTGTSWGTMAIVIPIIIPLTFRLAELSNYSDAETQTILYAVVSSVLAGSVFGDHCSPISDTTILSSMASKCNHIDHVQTQLPYAIVVALVCIILGYLPAGFGLSPLISLPLILISLVVFLKFYGKKLPSFSDRIIEVVEN